MGGAGVESSVIDPELHGGGSGPQQLLGGVEAALAALKGSAVSDRDTQTVEAMEMMMAVTNTKIDQGALAEFAEVAVRSVVARLTEAPTNLHQSTPGLVLAPTSHA